jgi:hypothetical protein
VGVGGGVDGCAGVGAGWGAGSGAAGGAGSGAGGGAGSGVGGSGGSGSGIVLGCGGAGVGLGVCGCSFAPPSKIMATADGGSGSAGSWRCGGRMTRKSSAATCTASETASAIRRMRFRLARRRRRAPGSSWGARKGAGAPAVMG